MRVSLEGMANGTLRMHQPYKKGEVYPNVQSSKLRLREVKKFDKCQKIVSGKTWTRIYMLIPQTEVP